MFVLCCCVQCPKTHFLSFGQCRSVCRLATVQLLGTMLLRLAGLLRLLALLSLTLIVFCAGAQGRLYVGDQPEDESKDIATVASRAQERCTL